MTRGAAVHVEQLGKRFGSRAALHGLNLSMRSSEFVSVVGKSGSGKSTLLRVLCGLEAPSEGSARIDTGTDADAVRVVFQEPRLLPWRSVLDNVRVGLHGESSRLRALAVLAQVGLADRASEFPGVLSGGEKQRVALARALFCEPRLMLFDEPFGALDALTRVTAQRLVERLWQERGFSALLVTHDVEEAVLLGDRVLVFEEGRVVRHVQVDLPRPRRREHPEVGRVTAALLDSILGGDAAASQAGDARPLERAPERSHDTTDIARVETPAGWRSAELRR